MFGPDPFSPKPQEDGELSDAIDRAIFFIVAVLLCAAVFLWSNYA